MHDSNSRDASHNRFDSNSSDANNSSWMPATVGCQKQQGTSSSRMPATAVMTATAGCQQQQDASNGRLPAIAWMLVTIMNPGSRGKKHRIPDPQH
jgi:hypothetical protein